DHDRHGLGRERVHTQAAGRRDLHLRAAAHAGLRDHRPGRESERARGALQHLRDRPAAPVLELHALDRIAARAAAAARGRADRLMASGEPPPPSALAVPPRRRGRRSSLRSWRLRDQAVFLLAWTAGIGLCLIAGAIVVYLAVQGVRYLDPSLLTTSP